MTKIARDIGVEFDRSQTKKATEARAADNARKLEEAKRRLLEEFHTSMDELHSTADVFKILSDGSLAKHEMSQPTFADKRHIMFRANGCLHGYVLIDSHQGGGEDLSQVDDWLDAMAGEAS